MRHNRTHTALGEIRQRPFARGLLPFKIEAHSFNFFVMTKRGKDMFPIRCRCGRGVCVLAVNPWKASLTYLRQPQWFSLFAIERHHRLCLALVISAAQHNGVARDDR